MNYSLPYYKVVKKSNEKIFEKSAKKLKKYLT